MTDRPVNALEVRYLGKLVGWLSNFDGAKSLLMIKLVIDHPSMFAEDEFSDGGHVEERIFTLAQMCHDFSRITIADSLDHYEREIARSVPAYAEKMALTSRDAIRFHWRAVKLDQFEEYEFVFEYPHFIPRDGPLDFEALADERAAHLSSIGDRTHNIIWLDEKSALTPGAWADVMSPYAAPIMPFTSLGMVSSPKYETATSPFDFIRKSPLLP